MRKRFRTAAPFLLCFCAAWGLLAPGCRLKLIPKNTSDGSTTGCLGACSACDNFSDRTQCLGQNGCDWPDEACAGDCSSCTSLSTEPECSDQQGCNWDPVAPCTGTCTSCDSYAVQAACENQAGCTFTPEHCTGTPQSCGSLSQGDCANGCTYDPEGPCTGGYKDCTHITDPNTCNTRNDCSWGSSCTGTQFLCSTLSQTQCGHMDSTGCEWDLAGPCEGTPDPCAGRSLGICTLGCTWVIDDCSGICTACGDVTTQGACNDQAGCTWDPLTPCRGSCAACSTYTAQGTCDAQLGCSWESSDECLGSCTSCGTYQSEQDCVTQAGCTWSPP